MKRLLLITLTLVMLFSLAACGGEKPVTLVDVTTDQGISLQLPSDMVLQDNGAYQNPKTYDVATFGTNPVGDYPLATWTEEDVAGLAAKYTDVKVVSFSNSEKIDDKSALLATLTMKNSGGTPITLTLVVLETGVQADDTDYIISLIYPSNNVEGSLAKNLQAVVDSIKLK